MGQPGAWPEAWAHMAENLRAGWSWSGFETSTFFLNDGSGHFTEIAPVLGLDQISDGRALAAGDLDNDGDIDLVGGTTNVQPYVYVLRNDLKQSGHHLFVEPVPAENRSAAGTIVRVVAGGRTQRRDVTLGKGFMAQHALPVHFGLGTAERVEQLEVVWPTGERQVFEGIEVDRKVVARQGTTSLEVVQHGRRNAGATARVPEIEWDRHRHRLRLVEEPWPDLSEFHVTKLDGSELSLVTGAAGREPGGPALLVTLWATWCGNCKREMPELIQAHAEQPDGLTVIGLAVDEDADTEHVARVAAEWGIDFPVAHVTGPHLNYFMQRVGAELGGVGGALTLPTSILLTHTGRVVAVADGAVDVDEVAALLRQLRR